MALKTYNIKTDFGANNALGDSEYATAALTINNGSPTLTAGTAIWSTDGSENGKTIGFQTDDTSSGFIVTFASTINSISGGGTVANLSSNFSGTSMAASSHLVEWGHDDSAAFLQFWTDAKAWLAGHPGDTFQLDIPAGGYALLNYMGTIPPGASQNHPFSFNGAIIEVVGSGRTTTWLTSLAGAGTNGIRLGNLSATYILNDPGSGLYPGSLIDTVNAGSTSVQLKAGNVGEYTRFNTGDIAIVGSCDIQGDGSVPPSWQFIEYVDIVSVTSGGLITFTPALQHQHKSTWPIFVEGGVLNPWEGGPAAINPIYPEFRLTSTVRDMALRFPYDQLDFCGQNVTMTRVDFVGASGVIPHNTRTMTYNDCSMPNAQVEIDKMNGNVIVNDSFFDVLYFQSPGVSSTTTMTLNNTTCNMSGTPANMVATNCTFPELRLGCYAYGISESAVLNNCSYSISTVGGIFDLGGLSHIGVNNYYSMSGGVITDLSGGGYPIPWAIPGALIFWITPAGWTFGSFTVLDIAQTGGTGSAELVYTNWTGGSSGVGTFPVGNAALLDAGKLSLRTHICPELTITPQTDYWPAGRPFGSYWYSGLINYSNVGSSAGNYSYTGKMWGKLVSLTIEVRTAYTGTQPSLTLHFPGVFDNFTVVNAADANSASTFYAPQINLRQTGIRVVTPSGVTFNGSAGSGPGDSGLTLPYTQSWFTNESGYGADHDIHLETTAGLEAYITVVLDQGFEEPEPDVEVGVGGRSQGYKYGVYKSRPIKIPHA